LGATRTCQPPNSARLIDSAAALIDSAALSALMVRHNIGVQDQQTYVIKRVDEDFLEEN
jgi:restriction system protein